MGRWGIAGHGKRAPALAGCAVGNRTERLLHRLSAGGGCGAVYSPAIPTLGLARDVLGGRCPGIAGLLHSFQGARIGGMETASRAYGRRHREDRERALEDLFLPRPVDDHDDVSLPRHTGSLSAFLEECARLFGRNG